MAKVKIATPDMFGGYSDGQLGFVFDQPAVTPCFWGMCGDESTNRVRVARKDGKGTSLLPFCGSHVGLAVEKYRTGWEAVSKI